MIKDDDQPKEPSSKVASRKWTNAEITKRLIEEKKKPKLVDPDAKPEIVDVISNDGNLYRGVNSFERKFKRDIRAMMEGYTANNRACYLAFLETRKRQLLKEKLRRLRAAQQVAQVVQHRKDLFG